MRKRLVSILLLVLMFCVLGQSVAAAAGDPWVEEYYRVLDGADQISDAERDELDEACIEFMRQYHLDLALAAVVPSNYASSSMEALAELYYKDCEFGYGETKDGFFFLFDTETGEAAVFCYGAVEGSVDPAYLDYVCATAAAYEADRGVCGVLSGALQLLSDYMAGKADAAPDPAGAGNDEPVRAGEDSGLPPWYPEDPANFTFYHDDAAPRIVDDADIFSSSEERQMETRLAEIRQETGKDIVVYTDNSSYGLSHAVCAADFYDFNGYGCGEEREGVVLFVCMEQGNRGWWVCCTGPDTMDLYTESYANLMDDALYEYMVEGDYAEGVADWIENFRTLYVKGMPFAPDWYPDLNEEFRRTHNADAPRVVDETGLLSASEIRSLTDRAAELSKKYGVDFVIHVAPFPKTMTRDAYTERYYVYNGYGFGENYDGLQLTVFYEDGYYSDCRLTASGTGEKNLTEVNRERLIKACEEKVDDDACYAGLVQWLRQVDHMERTGRVPRSTGYWVGTGAASLGLGSIVGLIGLGRAKRKMASPKVKTDADLYMDRDLSRILGVGSTLLYTSTSRRYAPIRTESSGRSPSGSGRSSYSSHYSGSSGSSHSGSGRRF